MTKINLHIEADTTHELQTAVLNLAEFCKLSISDESKPELAPAEPKAAPKKEAKSKPAPAPAPEPEKAPEAPAAPDLAPAPVEAAPEPAPAPVVKFEDIRAKLMALAKAGKRDEVQKLINGFGYASLKEIPAEKYCSLMAAAELL